MEFWLCTVSAAERLRISSSILEDQKSYRAQARDWTHQRAQYAPTIAARNSHPKMRQEIIFSQSKFFDVHHRFAKSQTIANKMMRMHMSLARTVWSPDRDDRVARTMAAPGVVRTQPFGAKIPKSKKLTNESRNSEMTIACAVRVRFFRSRRTGSSSSV
jgi:hypothetical protein